MLKVAKSLSLGTHISVPSGTIKIIIRNIKFPEIIVDSEWKEFL